MQKLRDHSGATIRDMQMLSTKNTVQINKRIVAIHNCIAILKLYCHIMLFKRLLHVSLYSCIVEYGHFLRPKPVTSEGKR